MFFFSHDTPTTEIYTLSLHDALPILVASELLEATRTISAGYVTPDRTTLVASSARVFTIDEKAAMGDGRLEDRKSTRLNSSHVSISYAVFCLKKKKTQHDDER